MEKKLTKAEELTINLIGAKGVYAEYYATKALAEHITLRYAQLCISRGATQPYTQVVHDLNHVCIIDDWQDFTQDIYQSCCLAILTYPTPPDKITTMTIFEIYCEIFKACRRAIYAYTSKKSYRHQLPKPQPLLPIVPLAVKKEKIAKLKEVANWRQRAAMTAVMEGREVNSDRQSLYKFGRTAKARKIMYSE